MHKQDKAIVWPAYFDQTKTRKEGRRVAKSLSVQYPKIDEIREAAQKLGLKPEVSVEKGFPKAPWHKGGMMEVEKKRAKEQILNSIAVQLVKARSTIASAPTKKK